MNRGQGPPGEVRAPNREAGRAAEDRRLAGGTSVVIFAHPADEDMRPHCDAAGIYCGALTVEQLEAAGRAQICCRHYLATEVA